MTKKRNRLFGDLEKARKLLVRIDDAMMDDVYRDPVTASMAEIMDITVLALEALQGLALAQERKYHIWDTTPFPRNPRGGA